MLWYKAWLETRFRMMMPLAVILFVLFAAHNKGQLLPGPKSVLAIMPVWWMLFPLVIAGSGIDTEAPFRIMKGVHGSAAFILSLPASRVRLFTARVIFGILMTVAFIAAVCAIAWLAFPDVRAAVRPQDGAGYFATALACGFAMSGMATFFATFLDQQIRMLACIGALLAPRLLEGLVNAPHSIDIFRAAGDLSPLITHTMPWTAISMCLALGILFFIAGLQIVQRREY
jgi:hypothetical protein